MSLLSLSKDLARLSADRINKKSLQDQFEMAGKDKLGSLKSLEGYMSSLTTPAEGRRLVGPLFGIYELRLADAHLPSSDYAKFYELAGVDPQDPFMKQGFDLIKNFVNTLWAVGNIIEDIKA